MSFCCGKNVTYVVFRDIPCLAAKDLLLLLLLLLPLLLLPAGGSKAGSSVTPQDKDTDKNTTYQEGNVKDKMAMDESKENLAVNAPIL